MECVVVITLVDDHEMSGSTNVSLRIMVSSHKECGLRRHGTHGRNNVYWWFIEGLKECAVWCLIWTICNYLLGSNPTY